MPPLYTKPLKVFKKAYAFMNPDSSNFGRNWKMFSVKDFANELIYTALMEDKPTMIARIGSNELRCLTNYLGVRHPERYKNPRSFIKSQTPAYWWEDSMLHQMQTGAGFFPARIDMIERFCELMIKDMPAVDILGSWLKEESFFKGQLEGSKKVMLEDLEPFFSIKHWTAALKDKKVLVIHPFAETIESQYKKREKLFDTSLLPAFELKTIKAIQSIAGEKTPFNDWFEALEHMKDAISATDFDICILGCGAYGFPLAAHVKSMGKKAVHLGGVAQLLFGIKGSRWETYLVYPYANMYNEYWVRPSDKEKPANASKVEGACYW